VPNADGKTFTRTAYYDKHNCKRDNPYEDDETVPKKTKSDNRPRKNNLKMAPAQPELKKVRSPSIRRIRGPPQKRDGSLVGKTVKEKEKERKRNWTEIVLQYLDKRLFVQLNGSRKVIGVLRGYDVRSLPYALSLNLANDKIGLLEHSTG